MKSFIRKKLPYIMIALQVVMIAGILLYIVPGRYRLYDIVLYDAAENMPANPLIGYAPPAEKPEDCENTGLVFVMLPFSELEPREGVFGFDAIEAKYNLSAYRAAGKHAVLRLVCDIPGEADHRDIPDWLYQKTGDGTVYEDASGKGYSPDYGNPVFVQAHKDALTGLAKWCKKDSFVSYVEMGSIGQMGQWESFALAEGMKPAAETVKALYAQQYLDAFPAESGIRLLSCPGSAEQDHVGEWNDVLGDLQASEKWVGESIEVQTPEDEEAEKEKRQNRSGDIEEQKTHDDYLAEGAASLWMSGPVGGGLTETIDMENLLMDKLSDTLSQIRKTHVSYIGPVCPDAAQQNTNGSDMILRNVGYSIYLSRLQTTMDFIRDDLVFQLSFSNIGNAPFYWDWPVTMYVYDTKGECIREQKLELSLSQLLPDSTITVVGTVPYSRNLLKGYSVGISITSPDGKNFITMTQKGVVPKRSGIHRIYRYRQ